MRFFSGSISSGKTAPSLFLHKQLDVTPLCHGPARFRKKCYNEVAKLGGRFRRPPVRSHYHGPARFAGQAYFLSRLFNSRSRVGSARVESRGYNFISLL